MRSIISITLLLERNNAYRAGLRHVRGVQPNYSAANFRGPKSWTLEIPYKLTCQFERL